MPAINVKLIEDRLALTLPAGYRRLLSDYPQCLHDTKLNLTWKHEPVSERQLYGTADRIIQANLDQRQHPTPWFSEEIEPWPEHMLVIGDDECGNYWCLDVTSGSDRVLFYNHELGAFEPDSESIADYVEKAVREVEEFNRDQGARAGGPAAE